MHHALYLFTGFFLIFAPLQLFSFNKVIIWGHKLHSHTHSYIHHAFYKAFEHLGYDTYWFDDMDDIEGFDFADSLFLTEGQVDSNIPLRQDCCYLLHNCKREKYNVLPEGKRLKFQVYTHDALEVPSIVELAPFTFFDPLQPCIYMPWATDLLPHEIEELQRQSPVCVEKAIYWIGTIGEGIFGNLEQILPFQRACQESGIAFSCAGCSNIDPEDSIDLIRRSYMAPAIVGRWQLEKGYIPCRIFKNISYGQMGITNSKTVYELFEQKIVYHPDTYQLFFEAERRLSACTREEIDELVNIVKVKHTYLNRVKLLLSALNAIQNNDAMELTVP